MAEVFVVTQGSYSDYHIVRVFSQRDLADAYVEAINAQPYEQAESEVWMLDTEPVAYGSLYEARWWASNDFQMFTGTFGDLPSGGISVETSEPGDPDPWIKVISTDGERARKVLGERRAQYLAEQAGIA